MKYLVTVLLILSAGVFSCRSTRHTKNIKKAILPRDTSMVLQNQSSADSLILRNKTLDNLTANYINFKTFSAKIKVEIENAKGKQPDITATLRMIKDSAIWMSLTATFLNIEVFRVYITKDSVILLNKQNKEVQYRSLDYLQEVTEIPFDFYTLQNLLVGNPVFFNRDRVLIRKLENLILISSIGKEFKNLLTLSAGNNFLLHSKLDDLDIARNRTADLTYDDYESSGAIHFSTTRHITASEKNRIDIRMNFKQFEFNKELSVAFSVPKNYKKK
jgi:hypothetical protein